MTSEILTALSGIVVGFALGLTGGGGSIFAVPLLIYLIGVDVRTAVGVSLASVGATSAFGVLSGLRNRQIDFSVGLIFAISGMLLTPVGIWIGGKLPPPAVIMAFALLMLTVGYRMWTKQEPIRKSDRLVLADAKPSRRSRSEILRLLMTGAVVGLVTGIFGVGGGFIIVPALVIFGNIPIHRAVSTSLMVITLICSAGVASHVLGGGQLPGKLTSVFIVGGCIGMIAGIMMRAKLSGPTMRRTFAGMMGGVAIFMIIKTIWLG